MKKITAILLVLIMTASVLVSCGKSEKAEEASSGAGSTISVPAEFDPTQVVASSGDTVLTAGDMTYILTGEYQSFLYELSASGYTPSLVKLDTSVSLREQNFGMGNGYETWFEYFADISRATAEDAVTLASSAKAEGITLTEDEQRIVDSSVADIMKNADEAASGKESVLGYGVTEENVRNVITVTTLAAKYMEVKIGEADISDEAIEALYEEYKYSYEKVDYMLYAFDYRDLLAEDATEDEIEAAKATSRGYAETMAALGDEESFRAYAKENMINILGLTEDEADGQFRNLVVNGASYNEKDPDMVWAFSAEVGEVLVEEREDGVIELKMLFAYNTRDESINSRDVRHILFTKESYTDDTKVHEVYDKWVADGAKVEDFIALAAEYSEDPGSKDVGGLYEGVSAGEMVEEFNDWLFDPERAEGDHAIVETADYGWHIMYYEGGESTWRADMIERIQNEAYTNALIFARDNHPTEINEEALANLPA